MNLHTQIRQQQSTGQMLEKLLRAKRRNQEEVDQAKRRLADLQEQENFKPRADKPLADSSPEVSEGSFIRFRRELVLST